MRSEDNRLKGKIAWVTGSGRGIGRSIATGLAATGAQVVLCARSQDEIDVAADQIIQAGGQALAIACDVSHRTEVSSLLKEVSDRWGDVDILVNNAGLGLFDKIINAREEDWDAMMAINLKGAFLCTQGVLGPMIDRQSGDIVNIVSVAGRQGYYKCAGYCASKFGLYGFTEVLRMETRKHGIRVMAVMPGATDTDIWGDANVERDKMMSSEQVARTVIALCCAPREVMPEEVVVRPISGDV